MNPKDQDQLTRLAANGLRELAEEFAEEVGRPPASDELFQILTWGLRSSSEDTVRDVQPANVEAIVPRLRKGAIPFESWREDTNQDFSIESMNDNVFVEATDLLVNLSQAVAESTGEPPTVPELIDALVAGLHGAGDDLLADVRTSDVVSANAKVSKRSSVKGRPGDVIAIPARNAEYFPAVILARTRFGTAYGLFEGTSTIRAIAQSKFPPARRFPVYTGDRFVANARWKIVGHDQRLLASFPTDPEIYHHPSVGVEGVPIGPYGSAETASGQLREITMEEAESVGLLSGAYDQVMTEEELEEELNRSLG